METTDLTTPLLQFAKFDERAKTPTRNNPEDAGLDIYTLEEVVVRPGEVVSVRTGIHIVLAEGQTALFWDKSGRAANGLTILGGCIDGPYRGELIVVVTNVNTFGVLDEIVEIAKNARDDPYSYYYRLERAMDEATVKIPYGKAITQMLITNLEFPVPSELSTEAYLSLPATSRGTNGFGSSDAKEGPAG